MKRYGISVLLALVLSVAHAQTPIVNCDVDTALLLPDAEETAMLDAINTYRASYGETALFFDSSLERASMWKARSIAQGAPIDHNDSFRSWERRLYDCGYHGVSGTVTAENLAGGYPDTASTLYQWQTSPAHNENLLRPNMHAVGIARVQGGAFNWVWAYDAADDGVSWELQ